MNIQFLGTGDAFCSGNRLQTCFLVHDSDFCFLIDCGATSQYAFKKADVDTSQVDGIIITHFHGDHFGGLPYLLLDNLIVRKRTRPMVVVGPKGIADKTTEILELLYPGVSKKLFPIQFFEYQAGNILPFGPLHVEAFPVVHVPETLPHGIRITSSTRTVAFSGDTGWTENLYKIAAESDLFICECNFYNSESPSHLNYLTVKKHWERFNCKRIILNHLGMEMLENLDQVALECSHDGLIIQV